MSESINIQSVRDSTRLIFSEVERNSFTAAVESSHFSGKVVVSTFYSAPPSRLFDEMSREWTGWKKEKIWGTLEDEITLTATSDRIGHIELVVVIRDYTDAANWQLKATLHLEAGQLEELARTMRTVFK